MALPHLAERPTRRGMDRLSCLTRTMGSVILLIFDFCS